MCSVALERLEERVGSEWPVVFAGSHDKPREYVEPDIQSWSGLMCVMVMGTVGSRTVPVRCAVSCEWERLEVAGVSDLALVSVEVRSMSDLRADRPSIMDAIREDESVAAQLITTIPSEYWDGFSHSDCSVSFADSVELI